MRILLTNDDGYDAPGLAAMRRALLSPAFREGYADGDEVEVVVVAPSRVQSATGHAITLHRQVEVSRRLEPYEGYAVGGRPADCVKLALTRLNVEPIHLVVSGMNAGANVGFNVFYSGTVGAAREATIQGFPAVATSLYLRDRDHDHWDRAAQHAADAIVRLGRAGVERAGLTTINVPVLDGGFEPKGLAVCPMSTAPLAERWEAEGKGEVGVLYSAGPGMRFRDEPPGTDVERLFDGWVTATPLGIDPTSFGEVRAMKAELEKRGVGVPQASSPGDGG